MPWRRLSTQFRSLRWRLTSWNTLVVLLAVVAALIGVREGLRYYLVEEMDRVLDDEAQELLAEIKEFYDPREQHQEKIIDAMERKSRAHEHDGWHVRWLDAERRTIWKSRKNAPEFPLEQKILEEDGRVIWKSSDYRSVERQVSLPGIPVTFVRVGTQTEFIDADVTRMTRIMAPVGIAIFLLAPLGGSFLANRAIDPLQRIITTTERLRPSHLEERLAIRGVDDELDQLAHKINQFLDQIADHLMKHREFLANAAHELRSPLAAIQSSVDVTLQKSRSPEEYQELLYSIEEECHRLGQLVNQVLELATSDAGVIEPRRVAVRFDEVIRQACEMFQAAAEERGVNLHHDIASHVTILGDPQQLRQLITNLIDNAIKFTPHEGQVTVTLKAPADNQSVRLIVEDTGIGVGANDLPRIFDRFYRADKSRQRGNGVQGSGLGLAICQAIVHAHHGQILVDSQLGVGTRFTVVLPSSPATVSGDEAILAPPRLAPEMEKPLASWAERHSPAS